MDQYIFSSGLKKLSFGLMGVGLIALVVAIMGLGGEHAHEAETRLWSNILINGFFFFSIAAAATFFMALQHAAEAGWATIFKRIFEAVGSYMPIGAIFLIIVFIGGSLHLNHLYHWMDPEAVAHDEFLQKKSAYLNLPFFWFRTLAYIGVWSWFMIVMKKLSRQEDEVGGYEIHKKNQRLSAIFLVYFGYTSSTAAWDWIMSIDAHWFSTLFGWYVFSGMWVSAMIAITLIVIYLKGQGYLKQVNQYHMQDLGKWMFGISCLWTYLWFSQFMLIWYANIPEEVTYFIARFEDYKFIYFIMIGANFIIPFFLLMDKENKRDKGWLAVVGTIIFFFHWLDVYLLVTPGTMKDHWHFGFVEIGMFLGFIGLFIFVVFNALSKAPLVVKKHPFLDESIHFQQN
jgi:hypothetical protein